MGSTKGRTGSSVERASGGIESHDKAEEMVSVGMPKVPPSRVDTGRQSILSAYPLDTSDIELPDGLGLTLMRELRGRDGLRGIAMSGFGAEEDLELSREAGFLDHLIKPIEPPRLDAAIRRARDVGKTDDDNEMAWSPTAGGDSGPFRVLSTHER